MGLTLFEESERELGWYYQEAHAKLGFRAQNVDKDCTGGVFDEFASQRTHMAMRTSQHREAARQLGRVESVLWRLDYVFRRNLGLAFNPWGAARASWQVRNAFTKKNVCVLALALETRAIRVAFAREHEIFERPPQHVLVQFLEWHAGKVITQRGQSAPKGSVLDRVMREAEDTLTHAVSGYDARRVERIEREQREEELRIIRLRERLGLERWAS